MNLSQFVIQKKKKKKFCKSFKYANNIFNRKACWFTLKVHEKQGSPVQCYMSEILKLKKWKQEDLSSRSAWAMVGILLQISTHTPKQENPGIAAPACSFIYLGEEDTRARQYMPAVRV